MKKNILMLLASGIVLSLTSCSPKGDDTAMHFEDESKWSNVYNCIKGKDEVQLKMGSETHTSGSNTTKDTYTIKMSSDNAGCITIVKNETFTENETVTEENTSLYWYKNNYDKITFVSAETESSVYGAFMETFFKNSSVADTVLYNADSTKTENKLTEEQSEALDEMAESLVSYIKNNYSIDLKS